MRHTKGKIISYGMIFETVCNYINVFMCYKHSNPGEGRRSLSFKDFTKIETYYFAFVFLLNCFGNYGNTFYALILTFLEF